MAAMFYSYSNQCIALEFGGSGPACHFMATPPVVDNEFHGEQMASRPMVFLSANQATGPVVDLGPPDDAEAVV